MLSKLKQHKSEGFTISRARMREQGFTIIEVMIVLAIAGLIILIVLLAVPALQRNSRNTAIKNDASALVGGISSFVSNSDGQIPTAISANGLISGAAGGVTEQAKLQGGTTVTVVAAVPTAVVTHGTLNVRLKFDCTGNANNRATAVYYSVETSSAESVANNNKCIDG